jgi:hypothetical protein
MHTNCFSVEIYNTNRSADPSQFCPKRDDRINKVLQAIHAPASQFEKTTDICYVVISIRSAPIGQGGLCEALKRLEQSDFARREQLVRGGGLICAAQPDAEELEAKKKLFRTSLCAFWGLLVPCEWRWEKA